jgi:hypothetical protein
MREIDTFIIHHSASPRETTAQDISDWHTFPPPLGRGWRLGNGYHRVVEVELVVDGRKIQWQGAHCKGWNQNSIGIVVTGNNCVVGQEWSWDQQTRLANLLLYLSGLWPAAKARGHRDMPGAKTECPGIDITDWLRGQELRRLI